MRYIPFLSRLAFICNIAFGVSVLLRYYAINIDQELLSTIVIIGFFMAVYVCSPLAMVSYAVLFFRQKPIFTIVPGWLVLANCIFFAVQIIYFFSQ